MSRLKSLLLLFLGGTFITAISSSKPRIFLEDGSEVPAELTLGKAKNITLTCRDVQPVQWRPQQPGLMNEVITESIKDCKGQDQEELPYCVSITINAWRSHVGLYPCVHNTTDKWADIHQQYDPSHNDSQAVYIWVREPGLYPNPDAQTFYHEVSGNKNESILVPCKPAFSSVKVKIEMEQDEEKKLDKNNFKIMDYDKKKGFTVMYTGNEHRVQFSCSWQATMWNKTIPGFLRIIDNAPVTEPPSESSSHFIQSSTITIYFILLVCIVIQ